MIQAALRRLYPASAASPSGGDLCSEHQKHLDDLVAKMKEEEDEKVEEEGEGT